MIVGASFAGLEVARRLWDYLDVTIIDRQDFFEYICTSARGIVKEDHIDTITTTYHQLVYEASMDQLKFVQGILKQVNRDRTIEIENLITGQPQIIEFDYLVLATGAIYGNPIRNKQNIYLADRLDFVKDYQRKL